MTICEADILQPVDPATEVAAHPQAPSDNGFVVIIPDSAWGEAQEYGSGQAFMLVREGDRSDSGPDGAVLARMDRYGGVGINALHVATGYRTQIPGGDTGIWLDPSTDVVPLFINNRLPSEGPSTRDFITVFDQRDGTYPFRVHNNGSVVETKEVVARDGQPTRVQIGNVYGVAGAAFGLGADTTVYRKAAGVVGVGNVAFFPKVTTEPALQPNGMVAFCIANAQGKLQAKVRFPTGASVVIATEP